MPWDTEDWSMQLAADGATELSMHDINIGAPEALRKLRDVQLQERKDRLHENVVKRQQVGSTDDLKERNRQALEKLRKQRAERLPEGWRMVESRSRKGEYVYENIHTEERQAWFPTEPAVKIDPAKFDEDPAKSTVPESGLSEEAKERNRRALAARKAKQQGMLPEGWRRVESRSRPGQYVYENIYTEERVAWYPIVPAQSTAMPMQALKPAASAELAKALYAYNAENDEEIDLQEGDEIIVEHKAANGWWIGTNKRTGTLGLFPGGFVELQ
eukprot:m.205220 g.205220  ORF g.205220 m.205220 type:complete len:272 (-) comp16894_c0_seq1:165-980(-)